MARVRRPPWLLAPVPGVQDGFGRGWGKVISTSLSQHLLEILNEFEVFCGDPALVVLIIFPLCTVPTMSGRFGFMVVLVKWCVLHYFADVYGCVLVFVCFLPRLALARRCKL